MNLKKTLVRISFLFLALTVLSSCAETSIEDEIGIIESEYYGSDRPSSGSVDNPGGDDSDDDYN